MPDGQIHNDGRLIWDVASYDFLRNDDPAPDTVHPGLWRQGRLNTIHGLFEVTDGVWQARGYDLANITFIAGDTGWVLVDVLTTAATVTVFFDAPYAWFVALLVPLVGWSRVRLRRHTTLQVVGGCVAGCLVAASSCVRSWRPRDRSSSAARPRCRGPRPTRRPARREAGRGAGRSGSWGTRRSSWHVVHRPAPTQDSGSSGLARETPDSGPRGHSPKSPLRSIDPIADERRGNLAPAREWTDEGMTTK